MTKSKRFINHIKLLLFFGITFASQAQQKFTISGIITDKKNGETIIGATIYSANNRSFGTNSNEYGFYSLTLPAGKHTIKYQYIGYQTDSLVIDLKTDQKVNKALGEDSKLLSEVIITGKKEDDNITNTQIGTEKLNIAEVKKLPVIFGEKDIIKTAQLLPGIKSGGEGSSGFYVRGGAADQNLILLDEAPVYNASHLLGFFSTFNSDALKDVNIIKGNSPANYGGRLSSVMDVRMKDGNNQKVTVSGGIGLISSRLSVEAPIVKDKGSFIISGRRSYADLFLKLTEEFKSSKLYFYDLNAKANYKVNENNRIYVSGYFGRDVLGVEAFGLDWGNATSTVRWNSILSKKFFSNTSLIYSKYNYNIGTKLSDEAIKINSEIKDWNIKQDFDYFANAKNTLHFGFNAIHHLITPTKFTVGTTVSKQNQRKAWENAIYLNNTQIINENLSFDYGIRLSGYTMLGGTTYNIYNKGVWKDSVKIAAGKLGKTYLNIEPRFLFNYRLNPTTSIKGGYARNTQNLHLLSNSTSGSPTDQWVGSSYNVKPELSDQISLGFFKNIADNNYKISVEAYYKNLRNQIDYRNGADVNSAIDPESELLFGRGRAYGAEFLIKKDKGKLTGWVGYTLSKTEKLIEGINNNQWYNARQDRTHDISVVASYPLSERWSVSGLFVFSTGNPATFPASKYQLGEETLYYFTERNGFRMPNYHRVDLSATYTKLRKKGRETSWNFGVYNAYGRQNAYTIAFAESTTVPNKTVATQTSLFRWVPSISYDFKF